MTQIELRPASVSQDNARVSVHFDFGDHRAAAAFRIKAAFRIEDGDFSVRFNMERAPTSGAAAEGAAMKCPTCGDGVTDIVHALDCDRHLQPAPPQQPAAEGADGPGKIMGLDVSGKPQGRSEPESIDSTAAAPPQPAPDAMRTSVLQECEEYFANRAATILNDLGGAPLPNLEMQLHTIVKRALAAPVPSPDGAGGWSISERKAVHNAIFGTSGKHGEGTVCANLGPYVRAVVADLHKTEALVKIFEDTQPDLVEKYRALIDETSSALSPPSAGAAEPDAVRSALAEIQRTALAGFKGDEDEGDALSRINNLALKTLKGMAVMAIPPDPAVGVTREAIAKARYTNGRYDLREVLRAGFRNMKFVHPDIATDDMLDAILALSPAPDATVSATPQQVQEACAQVADRAVASDEASAIKYPDEREKFEQRAHRGKTIATAIRALIPPAPQDVGRDATIERVSKRLAQMAENIGGMHAPELEQLSRSLSRKGGDQ